MGKTGESVQVVPEDTWLCMVHSPPTAACQHRKQFARDLVTVQGHIHDITTFKVRTTFKKELLDSLRAGLMDLSLFQLARDVSEFVVPSYPRGGGHPHVSAVRGSDSTTDVLAVSLLETDS